MVSWKMQAPLSGWDFVGATIASEVHRGVTYRLDRKLGQGGTASAYIATRTCSRDQSPVVMKIILPEVAAQEGGTAALVVKKEAVALGRLNERVPPTPFVVRFMDVGLVAYTHELGRIDLPWLAVEYVHGGMEGTTLQERVRFSVERTGFAFDRERAARALSHVCQGLAEVHDVGVIHRDLTPNNVLCCGFGSGEVFKIADFGIARPHGMDATLGPAIVGTPGYIAPEQGFEVEGKATTGADIFSLAGVAFYVLTGEPYFDVTNPLRGLMVARSEQRRPLAEVPTLCPELRNDPEARSAIDEALARATALDVAARPQQAKVFAASILPWLGETSSPKPSRRYVSSMLQAQPPVSAAGWNWTVRHPPGDDRIVQSVGWDGDGHCLAATNRGLAYWNGTEWVSVPTQDQGLPGRLRFVRRIGPGRWLLGGDRASLVEYSRSGVAGVLRGAEEEVTFTSAGGDLGDLAVVAGEREGAPPVLCARVGGYWLKPLAVEWAATISAVCRIDEVRWLVVGRNVNGRAFAAIYSPLEWQLDTLPAPDSRALVACASRVEREVAVAVGGQGAVVRVERGQMTTAKLDSAPNLAAAAVDVLDREWAGGAGQLWVSAARGENWSRVWYDEGWRAPFVSILADVGLVVAMTADGGVLECRAPVSDRSIPPTLV